MPHPLAELLVAPTDSIRRVMACIDRGARGIALVVDVDRRLLGTITDGDLRRTILAGTSLDAPARTVLAAKSGGAYGKPLTATVGTPRAELRRLMLQRRIAQVPLLDEADRVVDLVTLAELETQTDLPVQAMIMAGGFGKRLAPLTANTPKPMLPVGDKPVIERTIDRLREAGIRQVSVATHYLADQIKQHFGDGSRFGVELHYVQEPQPLGTAGAVGLLAPSDQTLLVMNGDILTGVDFRAMLAFHREQSAELTVGVRQYEIKVPFGVMDCVGETVRDVREKPTQTFLVNAGIYLLEPAVHAQIARDQKLDMPDLIRSLVGRGRRVVSFPIVEYWLDIGQIEDYQRAQRDVLEGRLAS